MHLCNRCLYVCAYVFVCLCNLAIKVYQYIGPIGRGMQQRTCDMSYVTIYINHVTVHDFDVTIDGKFVT